MTISGVSTAARLPYYKKPLHEKIRLLGWFRGKMRSGFCSVPCPNWRVPTMQNPYKLPPWETCFPVGCLLWIAGWSQTLHRTHTWEWPSSKARQQCGMM